MLRLLRDFDDMLFKTPPSADLEVEMKRLDELDRFATPLLSGK
jgi:hypothetical protein